MGCDRVDDGKGGVVFICGRGRTARERCSVEGCGRPAVALCDFPLKQRHPQAGAIAKRTCSRPLCRAHATRWDGAEPIVRDAAPGEPLDLCPAHARHTGAGNGEGGAL